MANKILKVVKKSISFKTTADCNPAEFFKTRDGLYAWSNLSRILEKAKPVKAGKIFKLSSFELRKYANDEMIEADLPPKHLFNESDVCALIADLIAKQSKGEEGALLNSGYANLFYTKACVVFVRWDSWYGYWRVYAWQRDVFGWYEGYRVFSPQLALKL